AVGGLGACRPGWAVAGLARFCRRRVPWTARRGVARRRDAWRGRVRCRRVRWRFARAVIAEAFVARVGQGGIEHGPEGAVRRLLLMALVLGDFRTHGRNGMRRDARHRSLQMPTLGRSVASRGPPGSWQKCAYFLEFDEAAPAPDGHGLLLGRQEMPGGGQRI